VVGSAEDVSNSVESSAAVSVAMTVEEVIVMIREFEYKWVIKVNYDVFAL
jgi:hypothetical protein